MHLVCSAAGATVYESGNILREGLRRERYRARTSPAAPGPHPGTRWSPHYLSVRVSNASPRSPVQTVIWENVGHYPMEEPGLQQMHDTIGARHQAHRLTRDRRE